MNKPKRGIENKLVAYFPLPQTLLNFGFNKTYKNILENNNKF